MDNETLSNPHQHHGHAKASTRHFIIQRLTGALNIVCLAFFVWLIVNLAGADRAQMVGVFSNWFVALFTAVMVVSVCVHMRIGMTEVIDDYIHDARLRSLALLFNTGFALAVGLVALISLVTLAFGG